MALSNITIPSFRTLIPVDTRTNNLKVLLLPTVSTNPGQLIMFKDYYGTATNSTFTISTTGTDLIDDINWRYTFSNAFGSMGFVSDGLRSWRTIGLYDGALTPAGPTTGSTSNLVFSHPDGRTWKVSGTNVRLNSGTQASLWLYNNANVFSNADGAVGLLNSNDLAQSVRHAGFTMFYNTFSANNLDFGWKFFRSGTGYNIYNYFSGGHWVGYDSASDTVLIVTPADARRVTWTITPDIPSQFIY